MKQLYPALFVIAAFLHPLRGEITRLAYNQPDLDVDLGVGLWAWPMPMDWDDDGDLDLIVSCPDVPSNGTYLFENPGKGQALKPAKKLGPALRNAQVSYVDGQPRVLVPGYAYTGFLGKSFATRNKIYPKTKLVSGKTRANQWKYLDFDGDGVLDLSVGVGEWTDYGWDNAFNDKGEWTNGPLHGWVFIIRNKGTNERPDYEKPFKLAAAGAPIDVYGMPSPCFADFDRDGDLDLICGEFLDGFTWFENIGTRTRPEYNTGHRLGVYMDLQMITPTAVDWDGDGDTDLICGDEDGRVAFIEYLGETKSGPPAFAPPVYLKQQADKVKFGALVTPVGVDWDGDGDDDIIAGNTAGYIGFIENLGEQKWAAPARLEAGDEVIRIQAGPRGSIQGPCEAKWGYTTLSVADWDNDDRLDIIANSIWGKIVWYRGLGKGALAPAQPIAFVGTTPKPSWNWWNPAPGEFVSQWRTTPVVCDWDKNGTLDIVMLDHEGFLALFVRNKTGALQKGRRIFHDHRGPLNLTRGAAGKSGRRKLCVTDWDGDGDFDILINSSNVSLLRNTRTKNGNVILRDEGPLSKHRLAGHTTSPTMIDLNGDGKQELLIGAEDGFLYQLGNTEAKQTELFGTLTVSGRDFETGMLANGKKAFSNRSYTWQQVPEQFDGWTFTRTAGGERAQISVETAAETPLFMATSAALKDLDKQGWEKVPGAEFHYTDKGKTRMQVYRRSLQKDEQLHIPQVNWTGSLLLFQPDTEFNSPPRDDARPNVLFIAVDDMRVELGCYGNTQIKSPHIDALAARSTLFERAYCQQAVCNPSRASLMTGLRPETLGIWNLATHFREKRPDIVTLPQLFKQQGYYTQGIGKLFHNWRQQIHGDPQSWSTPEFMHYATHGADKAIVDGPVPPDLLGVPRASMRDVADDAYYDGRIALEAVNALRNLKDRRFFLGVGFWKPHTPFNAPKKYWDLYKRQDIALAEHPDRPVDAPAIALHDSREIKRGFKHGVISDEQARALRHGYFAAISYVDAQIGKVLTELKRLDLEKNTLVVFWSDHGFHLGEHDLWAKTSNFELDARVPMMIALPGQAKARRVRNLVELLDLYPTLAAICNLQVPHALEGLSLLHTLEDKDAATKPAAFTWHPRPAYPDDKKGPEVMGYSMRTDRYRYTEWRNYKNNQLVARELYDHHTDTHETRNLASQHAELTARLSKQLNAR